MRAPFLLLELLLLDHLLDTDEPFELSVYLFTFAGPQHVYHVRTDFLLPSQLTFDIVE